MTELDKEALKELLQEVAKLEHEFNFLLKDLSMEEWTEVLERDMIADAGRRQNQMQAYIRHAQQIIAARKHELQGTWSHEVVADEVEFHPDISCEIEKAFMKQIEATRS